MRKIRPILWVPLLAFVGIAIAFAVQLAQPDDRAIHSAMVGKSVPVFALPAALPDRPGLASTDLANGQPHLVNIFASWCIPCRAEAGPLAELARRGIPIDGIAVRDRPEDLAAFLAQYGDPFRTIGADNDRRVQLTLGSAGVPETFVVDGNGVIRHQHIGAIMEQDIPAIVAAWEAAR
jgi:cytochrome c biogenesis protein CcmG/thiol:disulfide interchange protein DsbE